MNHQEEDTPGSTSHSSTIPTKRPRFLESMEQVAARSGSTVKEVLAAERARALRRPATMTDDCLLPDEAEDLIASANLEFVGTRLAVRDSQAASRFERDAVDHVNDCLFCQSLLQLMKPKVEEREAFLAKVREQSKAAQNQGPAGDPGDPRAGTGGAWATVRSAWPVVLPAAIAAYAFGRPAFEGASPLEYAFSASWPVVVVAGIAAAMLTKLALALRSPTPNSSVPLAPSTPRRNPGSGVLTVSVVATLCMSVAGLLSAYRTDRVIIATQEAMAADSIGKWSAPAFPTSTSQELEGKLDCEEAAPGNVSLEVCRLRERIPLPGNVVRERTRTEADLYWAVSGEKRREVVIAPGEVVASGPNGKTIKLASGNLRLPDVPAEVAQLAIGSPVFALQAGPESARLVQALISSPELSKHNFVRVSVSREGSSR